MKKNLLIGSIIYFIWEDVAPFFKSYQQAGFENCDCVMFVANIPAKTIEKIKSCGVTVYKIPESYNGKCINDYRWELYADFLKDKRENYNMIFTSDVRDAFFQRDIFEYYDSSKPFLGIALETSTISENYLNKRWILKRYGESVFDAIKNNTVICTGTVSGTYEEFLKFTVAMAENLSSNKYNYFNVSDQAAGNFLIYHDKMFIDCLVKSDNETGYVITGITKSTTFDSENNILNGKGEIAAVVHQYDRHPYIVEKVVNKFCPEIKGLYYEAALLNREGLKYSLARVYYKLRKKGFLYGLKAVIRKLKKKLTGQEDY